MAMAMAMTRTFSPNHTLFPATKHSTHRHVAAAPPPQTASPDIKTRVAAPPVNVDYLEEEFSGRGVAFQPLGDGCVAKLALKNGSAAALMLPSGLLTSYKAAMWHGGTDEILHSTVVPKGEGRAAAEVHGGVSLALEFKGEDGVAWAPSNWTLHQISGNSRTSIQVELISTDSGENIEIKYVVTLRKDELKSEISITNSRSSSIQLSGCILSHLRVSSPEVTYAIGLEASDFFKRTPFASSFGIIPPDYGLNKGSRVSQLLDKMAFWQPNRDEKKLEAQPKDEEMEGEETENYKNLKEEMCMVYTSAPRNVTLIDRGRRNSVIVARKGFAELYMFSPGSSYEIYGENSFVCVGQSAMLKPLNIGPEQVLKLGQDLYNPNL